jgi:hypothetical protein
MSSYQLPFAHLNLKRNPFGELRLDRRGAVAVGELDEEIEHLREGGVVQFVGESGRGKSTALHALAHRLDVAAYVRVPRDGTVPNWPEADLLLVDELQFLDRSARLDLWQSSRSIACGTHVSFDDEIREAGRRVETIDLNETRSLDELAAMFRRRIVAYRRDDERPVPTLERATLRRLRERYGSDHRAMENHLYEVFQTLDEPRPVVPEDLEGVDPAEASTVGRASSH